jgi:RimJ/RimL family protein N-acetyltransferase
MVSLRRATADDIAFIMATERLPGYDVLVGCFEEAIHRANLADDNWLYLIGLDASGARQGFAVLQDRHDGDGSEFIRRVAVANAGRGFGKPFLAALIDWIFTHSDNARCHLHVRAGNGRARHVYGALGFQDVGPEEGVPCSRTMVLSRAAWSAR